MIAHELSEELEVPWESRYFNRERVFSVSDFSWLGRLGVNSCRNLMRGMSSGDSLSER